MRRLVPVLLLGAALGLAPAGSTARAAVTVRLRSQSLQAVCTRLSERLTVTLTPERSQADLRLLWPEPDETSLPTALARLAELTDSQVVQEDRQRGHDCYTLERRAGTVRREQGWETAALSSAINRLRLAYVQTARGDRRVAAASSNGHYLRMEHVDLAARFLNLLTLDHLRVLATEEEVRFPPELLTEAEGKRIVRSVARHGLPAAQEETDDDDDPRSLRNLELLRKYGMALQLQRATGSEDAALMMRFSTPGSDRFQYTSFPLGRFSDAELGLPSTRSNPYRVLEGRSVVRPVLVAQLPVRLREPLGAGLKLSADTSWREALQAFAQVAEVPVMSDDYLCRSASRSTTPREPLELAATTSTTEVLDRLCAAYRYLWWEKDGCLYFRSRCWPRDIEIETPPRVTEQLSRALNGRGGQLGPGEVAALSGLTRRQLQGLSGFLHPSLPGFLMFYDGLPTAQQAALVGDGAVVQGEHEFVKIGRLAPGEPVRLQLEQQIKSIGEKTPRGWTAELILHAAPVSNSAARSSSFFRFYLPNTETSEDAKARRE